MIEIHHLHQAGGLGDEDMRLASQDVLDIYRGVKTKWSDGTPVRFVLRPEFDTDTKTLLSLFPTLEPALAKARGKRGILVASSDQKAMDAAARVGGMVTTGTLTAITTEHPDLRPFVIDGVEPTAAHPLH